MSIEPSSRYTPKHSHEALRQSWLTKNPYDPRLNSIGRRLAFAARYGPDKFEQLCRELEPEI